MATRYDKALEIQTDARGRQVYKTVRPLFIQPSVRDITITANEQTRFDVIANNVYGHPGEWWRIASVNGKVNGSLYSTPGNTVIIPVE